LLERASVVAKKQARLYAKGGARALNPRQLDSLRSSIRRFSDRIAASAQNDAIAPRAISPAEVS
jgi:hypothetical protein